MATMNVRRDGAEYVGELDIPGAARVVVQSRAPTGAAAMSAASAAASRLYSSPAARALVPPQAALAVTGARMVGGWLSRLVRRRRRPFVGEVGAAQDSAAIAIYAGAAALLLSTTPVGRRYWWSLGVWADGRVSVTVAPDRKGAEGTFAAYRITASYAAMYHAGRIVQLKGVRRPDSDLSGEDADLGEVGIFRRLRRALRKTGRFATRAVRGVGRAAAGAAAGAAGAVRGRAAVGPQGDEVPDRPELPPEDAPAPGPEDEDPVPYPPPADEEF